MIKVDGKLFTLITVEEISKGNYLLCIGDDGAPAPYLQIELELQNLQDIRSGINRILGYWQ